MNQKKTINSETVRRVRETDIYNSFTKNLRSNYGDDVSESQVYVHSGQVVINFEGIPEATAKIVFEINEEGIITDSRPKIQKSRFS